jgi:hypothetical protein
MVRGQKIEENMSGVLLALRRIEASKNKREYMCSIGTVKDWSAHRVQEWQLVYVPVGCPYDCTRSENKREYVWCFTRASENWHREGLVRASSSRVATRVRTGRMPLRLYEVRK